MSAMAWWSVLGWAAGGAAAGVGFFVLALWAEHKRPPPERGSDEGPLGES
jgi:hypothetical protein